MEEIKYAMNMWENKLTNALGMREGNFPKITYKITDEVYNDIVDLSNDIKAKIKIELCRYRPKCQGYYGIDNYEIKDYLYDRDVEDPQWQGELQMLKQYLNRLQIEMSGHLMGIKYCYQHQTPESRQTYEYNSDVQSTYNSMFGF
jgi:hypothetical protein